MNLAQNITQKVQPLRRDHPINKEIILINALFQQQREYFTRGHTLDLSFRMSQLRKLRVAIDKNRERILEALREDLKKPPFEAYASEIALINREINYTLKHLKKWMRGRREGTPLFLRPSSSRILPEPYGVTLIIGPWNYPFQLTLLPLVGALAAGNTAIIKPSELTARSEQVIHDILSETFDRSHVAVIQGGVETTRALLEHPFDYIFFTGSTEVGRVVMEAAARNLVPVTLELGGKSPVIVDRDASVDLAAWRIAWGKFLNAGQTCIAPDYVLAHRDIKKDLIERIRHYIREFYGENPKASPDYARIVNERHFHRLIRLIKSGKRITGGQTDEKQLYIAPTVFDEITPNHPIMKEEIFGPLLPVMEFGTLEEALEIIRGFPKPLALYIFSGKKETAERVIRETSSGGVVINDVVLHVSNHHLPFGGVGESGMGAYHGKSSFIAFSHQKSVMKGSRFLDNYIR